MAANRTWLRVVLIFALVLVGGSVLTGILNHPERDNLQTFTSRCKETIKGQLRDPDSAVFEQEEAERVAGTGGYVVTLKLRAKNGFGGYVRSAMICKLDAGGRVISAFEIK